MKKRMMRGMRAWVSLAGWALACAGAGWAQQAGTQPAGTEPGVAVRDDAYWQGLEDRLGNDDAKVRAAATKELEGLPWQSQGRLEQLAAKCPDPQVKASLQERIDGIADQLATDPPGISVDLHKARLSEVVAALKAETGVAITSWPGGGSEQGSGYTLTMKDKPFWEVMTALCAQHPLMVQRSDRFQLVEGEPALRRGMRMPSGFYLFPGQILRNRSADLQINAMGEERLTLSYTLAVDPRVRVVSRTQPELTEVTDDAGNVLLSTGGAGAGGPAGNQNMMMEWQRECLFQGNSALNIMPNMGKKIVSAKGQARFVVQVSEVAVVVEKPAETLKQPVKLGDETISIEKFEPKEERIDFNITRSEAPAAMQRNFGRGMGQQTPMRVQFLDVGNDVVWESQLYGGTGGGVSTSGHKGPFHIRFSLVNKTRDVTVDFEMKDIPIP